MASKELVCKDCGSRNLVHESKYTSSQERGSPPCPDCGSTKSTHVCLMHKQGWQSDGQIGATGSKI
jgi:hypothetical protein